MADVNKVKGNINQPEPDKAREKSEPDVEELREKWAKVGKVDPDQKKERKAKAQEEAETREKQTKGKKPILGAAEPSIFEPKAPKAPPPAQGAEAPPPAAQTPQAAKTSTETPSASEPQGKEKASTPAQKKKTVKRKKAKAMGKEALTPTTQAKPTEESHKAKEPEKKHKPAEVIAPEPLPLAQGAWEATGKETDTEKKKDKEVPTAKLPTQIQQAPQDMPQGPAISDTTTTPAPPPLESPFANLPPQVQQLFEKMVGVMTVMNTTGVQETTISLDNPQFEKSVFYGAEIVITEFSSAPKAFNIELRGSENAMNLFAQNSQRILDEIQKNDYNFTVTRIDTSYLPKSKEEKRKESRPVKRKRRT